MRMARGVALAGAAIGALIMAACAPATIVEPNTTVTASPDAVERSTHLRLDAPTSSPSSSDGGVDWGLIALLASLGGIAVLGAGAVIGVRQRMRLA